MSEQFERIYERYAPSVYRRAHRFLGVEADAWDVVQDVFQKFFTSRFRGDASPMTYLYRITTNISLNRLRQRICRAPDPLGSPAHDEGTLEARNLVSKLMAQLDERSGRIAILAFMDGLTQEEIANVSGISRKTVQRTLEKLKRAAETLGQEVPCV